MIKCYRKYYITKGEQNKMQWLVIYTTDNGSTTQTQTITAATYTNAYITAMADGSIILDIILKER